MTNSIVDPEVSRGQQTKISAPGHEHVEDESLYKEDQAASGVTATPSQGTSLPEHSINNNIFYSINKLI